MTVTRFDLQHRRAVRKERRWEQSRHYKWEKRPVSRLAFLRVRELGLIFKDRYGVTLPDDDAGRDDLTLLFHHAAHTGGDVIEKMVGHAGKWAPWMPAAEARRLAKRIAARPLTFTADALADRLGLNYRDRGRLRLKTIGSTNVRAHHRKAFKKEADAERKKKERREKGVRSRAEYEANALNKLKPWLAEGVSRATWYRRRRDTGLTAVIPKVVIADRLVSLPEQWRPPPRRFFFTVRKGPHGSPMMHITFIDETKGAVARARLKTGACANPSHCLARKTVNGKITVTLPA